MSEISKEKNTEPSENSSQSKENKNDNNGNKNDDKNNDNKDKKKENINLDSSQNKEKDDDNKLLEIIKNFFGGPYTDSNNIIHDISYTTWVETDINIKKLCNPYEVVIPKEDTTDKNKDNNPFGVLTRHDYGCELKLIKWITEDETHKKNFIKIGNKGAKINRHNDILPYIYNAVPLDLNISEKNLDNYINASYIDDPIIKNSKLFIATQGPLKETIPSFWKMIYNHKTKLVIMLSSNLEEIDGRSAIYWPKNKEEILNFQENNLSIKFMSQDEIIKDALIIKKFKINDDLEIKQIHIICWPDHGMPKNQSLAIEIVDTMINYIKIERGSENKAPIVVHCSAGVGRTGTVIATSVIILCLEYLKKLNKPLIMNVFNVVRKLREQRYSLVTDTDQYKFIYDYCLNWIKKNYMKK